MKAAIVAIGYNRAQSMQRLLSSIGRAKYYQNDITLIISIDYHPDNSDVIEVANSFTWEYGEKIVNVHKTRLGLREHVLECGDLSQMYDCLIVLEDDLVVAEDFYNYATAAQERYKDDDRIAGVSLYGSEWNDFSLNLFKPLQSPYDIYFRQACESWGQSWTKKQWTRFRKWLERNPVLIPSSEMPSEIYAWPETSWGKYFFEFVVSEDLYLVYPYRARSTCFSDVGQHTTRKMNQGQVCLLNGLPQTYYFPQFDEGVHYDIFFESKDLQKYLDIYTNGEKCRIDLYGRHSEGRERFLLSTVSKPYSIIHSYGLEMRPPETNVIMNIEGEDIFLYDTNIKAKSPKAKAKMDDYELNGYRNKYILFQYCFEHIILGIIYKIKRLFHL